MWADKWQLSLSLDKCCVLFLRSAEPAVSFSLGGVNLSGVSSCRNLGITITSDLSPSVHIHDIVVKAHQRSNAIHRCFLSHVSVLTRAFIVYVRPLVEFNSVVWLPYLKLDINSFESVQRRFTKRLPGAYKLFKRQCTSTVRSSFFTERVANIWNCITSDTVNFSSLTAFKRTIKCVNFNFLILHN